jgi:hypothetical protein
MPQPVGLRFQRKGLMLIDMWEKLLGPSPISLR